jgi:hypothetical protein
MNKLIVFSLALFVTANVFAQTPKEIKESEARFAKMEKLVDIPKSSGMITVDALVTSCSAIAANSVRITPLLQKVYYGSLGQNNEGVADASVKKPTIAQASELNDRITNQFTMIKDAALVLPVVSLEVKGIRNPLKLLAPLSCLKYSKDVLAIAGEESAYQAKLIGDIMKTLKDKSKKK